MRRAGFCRFGQRQLPPLRQRPHERERYGDHYGENQLRAIQLIRDTFLTPPPRVTFLLFDHQIKAEFASKCKIKRQKVSFDA
jgi:hypothetical protein